MRFKLLTIMLALLLASVAWGQMPKNLSYQGVLTDTTGSPKDGNYSITFALYTAATGGVSVWSTTKSVDVNEGLFSVTLDIGDAAKFDLPYYLGIKVGSDPELYPRVALTAAAYSYRALRADSAAWVDGSGITNLNASNLSSGTVPNGRLDADLQDLATDGSLTGSKVGSGISATNITTGTLSGSMVGTGVSASNITTGLLPAARLDSVPSDALYGSIHNSLLDADLQDLADGRLSGYKVGGGINADSITTGTLADARLEATVDRTRFQATDYITATGGIYAGGSSDPNGNLVSANKTGLGTDAPDAKVDVEVSSTGQDGIIINQRSSGDPVLLYQLGAATKYAMGVDNSDADKFKIGTTTLATATSVTIDTAGNVGVGYSAPNHKLYVNGNSYVSDYLAASGGVHVGGTSDPGTDNLEVDGTVGIGTAPDITYGLRVDAGTATPYGLYSANYYSGTGSKYGTRNWVSNAGTGPRYGVYNYIYGNTDGDNSYGTYNYIRRDGYSGNAYGFYNDFYGTATAGNEYGIYCLDEDYNYFSGNVGIGNTAPSHRLDVAGNAAFADYIYHYGDEDTYLYFGSDAMTMWTGALYMLRFYENTGYGYMTINEGGADVDFRVESAVSTYGLYLQGNTGNVGIGRAPTSRLHIKTATSTDGLQIENDTDTDIWKFNIGANDMNLAFNGTNVGYWNDADGSYNATSDRRLKKNITALPDVLGKVMELQPSSFNFKRNPQGAKKTIGLIAQDVKPLFPELVSKEDEEKGSYYGINYDGFGVVAIKAIQEQQAIIDKQQKEIDELKTALAEIRQMLAK